MDAAYFEQCWRVGCFGGFLFGREAARRMAPRGRGEPVGPGGASVLRGARSFLIIRPESPGARRVSRIPTDPEQIRQLAATTTPVNTSMYVTNLILLRFATPSRFTSIEGYAPISGDTSIIRSRVECRNCTFVAS